MLVVFINGCTVYKTIHVTSDPPGLLIQKSGAIAGTTPFELRVPAGDNLFCTSYYWEFELLAESPFQELPSQNKTIDICKIPNNSTVHFSFNSSPNGSERNTAERVYTKYGTGFFICNNGYLITAYHVIANSKTIKLYNDTYKGTTAEIVKFSKLLDIAILRTNKSPENTISITNNVVKVGEKVFTIGYPVIEILGDEPKYTDGVISSNTGISSEASLMQITTPVQPGNSGGPLLNTKGELVGVIVGTAAIEPFLAETNALPQNVNWATKTDYIQPLLPKDCEISSNVTVNNDEIIDKIKQSICLIVVDDFVEL